MTREEMRKVKAGDLLTTKYGSIILVERVELGENAVRVYYYFYYDKEMGIQMNEWLDGFYGPKFDKDFYRHSTDEEKQFFFIELEKYGYMMTERYGKAVPKQTSKEYHRHHCKQEPKGLDEAALKELQVYLPQGNGPDGICYFIAPQMLAMYKAGAEQMAGQGVSVDGLFGIRGVESNNIVDAMLDGGLKMGDKVIVQIRKK